ncbi:hypothetical protein Q757_07100 [Oenococcus alcoholitolerans]|uniref:Uncharacterized protein n=1 Tax=Oenococcus alcoholitolerans TaxID=931074 RepID=A0ABR4XPS2_9LACO|nr:hypothetical protein Q757_07100 [Oenococcus alcoholitolerans]
MIKKIIFDVSGLKPIVTWGTNPGMAVKINEKFPEIRNKTIKEPMNTWT